ncbi:hypothetical protein NCC49_000366 [Naganishia albida]|nr:hypothetical protein NCC49_000366 [Naganishia albida]
MPARDTTFDDPTITATGQIRIFRDNHAKRSFCSNLYYYIRLKNNKRNDASKVQSDRVGVIDSRMQRAFYQFSKLVPDPELAAALPAALTLVPQVPSVATISRQALSGNNIGRIIIRCPNVNVLEIIKSDGPSMIRVNGELYDAGDCYEIGMHCIVAD